MTRGRDRAGKKRLPAPWLEPQVVNGYSVISCCILWLERLTISPVPAIFRYDTISSAYRIGVMDVYKEEVAYEPLTANVEFSELNEESWSDAGLELDSAVRARGARYKWTYRGLWGT